MRIYPVSDSRAQNDELPEGIVWNKKYQGWEVSSSTKIIEYKVLSQEEYYKFDAGDINSIFPEYDPDKHIAEADCFDPQQNDYTNIPVILKELTQDNIHLPFGCFIYKPTNYGGVILKKIIINTDKYIDLGNSPIDLYEDYTDFRKNKQRYIDLGRRPRKAALLYGGPGNSKTMEISKLAQHAEADKFRVFFVQGNISLEYVNQFKRVLENEDNVFVLEEITERAHRPEELLSFLDGEMSWNNCYTIATTNYPEELAWNLMDRPSRFKVMKEFLPPNAEQRRVYLTKVGFPEADIIEAVKITEGMSLDYLINIAFDAMFSNIPIQKVVADYNEDRKRMSKTFKGKMGMGG